MSLDGVAGQLLPGSLVASLLGAAWSLAMALLAGASVVAGPDGDREDAGDAALLLATWLVVGVAVLSFVMLAGSVAGVLTPRGVLAGSAGLTLVAAAIGGRRVLAALRAMTVASRRAIRGASAAELASAVACAAMLALAGALATIPTAHYDDLVYHLGLPRQALLVGHWPDLPHFHHSLMPAAWESQYLLPFALGGGSGPQLMNAALLASSALTAFGLARRVASLLPALAAVSLLLGSRVFLSSGAGAGNDLFVGLALLCALSWALRGRSTRGAILAGACAGAAAAAKFTGLMGAVPILLLLLFAPGGRRDALRRSLVAGACVLALVLPWSLRAFARTGNPVYPAFYGVLGGEGWDDEAAEMLSRDSATGAAPARGPRAFALGAGDLLLRSGSLGTPAGVHVLLLLGGIAGLLLRRREPLLRRIVVYLAASYVAWCATSLMVRFALAPLAALVPAAALAIAWCCDRLGARRADLRALPAVACVVASFAAFGLAARVHLQSYGRDTSWAIVMDRRDALTARIDMARIETLAARLPRDARLLVVGEARLALVPRPAVISTAIDSSPLAPLLGAAASPDELSALLAADGVTHVVVNEREMARFSEGYGFARRLGPGGAERLRQWLDGLEPLGEEGRSRLLALPRARVAR